MSEAETEPVVSEWTNESLIKLLASLKASIPKKDKMISYRLGLNNVDWKKVAFPPFSPEECRKKWAHIIEKMRKLRSLTELIAEAEGIVSDPLHNRAAHPEFPKKPTQARHLYFREMYDEYKKKHPELETHQILNPLLQEYQKLPKEKKAKYERMYAQEMVEYKKRMKEFGQMNKMRVPVVKSQFSEDAKYENMPAKPPGSGHILFLKENSQYTLGGTGTEAVYALSQRWTNLSETEKAAYDRRYKELKKQYYVDLQTYLNTFDEKEQKEIMRKKGIKFPKIRTEKAKKKRRGEPKMPANSAYSYFVGEQLTRLKKKSRVQSEHLKSVHSAWVSLSSKERQRYLSKLHINHRRYAIELQKWFKMLTPEEQESYLKENPRKSFFLGHQRMRKFNKEDLLNQPSDSEDEFMEISSDEEESFNHFEEEEEEEEDENITFDIY